MMQVQYAFNSLLGTIYIVATNQELNSISWSKKSSNLIKKLNSTIPSHRLIAGAKKQLEEYFKGKRKRFDLPLVETGTKFQQQVWQSLLSIPYGKTISYKQLAKQINHPKAVRAVGTANGKNPFCIIVPCHRVIAHDGSLGGYSGGLRIKKELLALEEEKN